MRNEQPEFMDDVVDRAIETEDLDLAEELLEELTSCDDVEMLVSRLEAMLLSHGRK